MAQQVSAGRLLSPSNPNKPPGRVRHIFKTWDTDQDGGLALDELHAGFHGLFGDSFAPHAKEAVSALFEAHATADAGRGKQLKIGVFNRFFAEILFKHFDTNNE